MSVEFWIGAAVGVPLAAVAVLAAVVAFWLWDRIDKTMAAWMTPPKKHVRDRREFNRRKAKALRLLLRPRWAVAFRLLGVVVTITVGNFGERGRRW